MSNAYTNLAKDSANTQNNLNPQQSVFPILKRHTENLLIEEAPTIIQSNTTTDMAIWDNANTTWDGVDADDEWDSYSSAGNAILHITNPRNYFIERFGFDTLVLGTGTQSTANKTFSFTAGQTYIGRAYLDGTSTNTVVSATLSTTETSGTYTYEMSANGGANWESVSLNTSHTFTNTGSDLRIRITENGASTGVITAVFCQYQLG